MSSAHTGGGAYPGGGAGALAHCLHDFLHEPAVPAQPAALTIKVQVAVPIESKQPMRGAGAGAGGALTFGHGGMPHDLGQRVCSCFAVILVAPSVVPARQPGFPLVSVAH